NQERIKKWGHRRYVGGGNSEAWYGIGKRQYHFLVANGLEPTHKFLDIACGSLRLGQYLIPMLNAGNYCGVEAEKDLVDAGIEKEILFEIILKKEPKFLINHDFNFSDCGGYDYAIAQSLFTHLTLDDISRCFTEAYKVANPGSKFYFTFFEGNSLNNPQGASHANRNWHYSYSELQLAAKDVGFSLEYIGNWGHERGQLIAVATKAR
ncbi:MAG: hypothetical protein RIB30_01115, partial [Thalassospira sp.]|uniref:hypothetical protein n=1 Tax=Thalassospira sp. TaxID=1912094 RepID=UPI0032EE54D9